MNTAITNGTPVPTKLILIFIVLPKDEHNPIKEVEDWFKFDFAESVPGKLAPCVDVGSVRLYDYSFLVTVAINLRNDAAFNNFMSDHKKTLDEMIKTNIIDRGLAYQLPSTSFRKEAEDVMICTSR